MTELGLEARLAHFATDVFRLCIWLVLLAVIFLPLERLFALHPHRLFRKELGHDLLFYFTSSLIPAALLSLPLATLAWGVHHLLPAAYFSAINHLPLVVRVLAAFVVGEVGFYWGHRWSHEIPFLWGFHAVHHSAKHMDFLVNTKAHPVDVVFTRLVGLVPLYVLGLAAPVRGVAGTLPLLVVLLGTVWGFFIHSNVRWRMGFFEHVLATPAFHHWHHTNDSPHLYDKNFAAMLPLLDRCFGTLNLPKDHHPERYGISQELSGSVLRQMANPLFGRIDSAAPTREGAAPTEKS